MKEEQLLSLLSCANSLLEIPISDAFRFHGSKGTDILAKTSVRQSLELSSPPSMITLISLEVGHGAIIDHVYLPPPPD